MPDEVTLPRSTEFYFGSAPAITVELGTSRGTECRGVLMSVLLTLWINSWGDPWGLWVVP